MNLNQLDALHCNTILCYEKPEWNDFSSRNPAHGSSKINHSCKDPCLHGEGRYHGSESQVYNFNVTDRIQKYKS